MKLYNQIVFMILFHISSLNFGKFVKWTLLASFTLQCYYCLVMSVQFAAR
jgi:hypothetical protein